jgi:hypothetical protein
LIEIGASVAPLSVLEAAAALEADPGASGATVVSAAKTVEAVKPLHAITVKATTAVRD